MFGVRSKIPSHMDHAFNAVPRANIPRSAFDRSHGYRTTFNASYLIPVYVDEALPGDTFSLRMSQFTRLTTPIKPIMDNLFLDSFFFAVPYRLVWSHWEKFNGAQDNPTDTTSFLVPTATSPTGGYTVGSLQDYMGLPTVGQVGGGNTVTHNNLHLRAYNLIWNTWFRDQNLQNSATVDTGDGPDTYSLYGLQVRGKRHDYFTSCLPWPQKNNLTGGGAVSIPLGTQAIIKSNAAADAYGRTPMWMNEGGVAASQFKESFSTGTNQAVVGLGTTAASDFSWPKVTDTNYNYADLSTATAATINQLRQAFQTQRMYERDARGGTRYTEIILSHFGVHSPDQRLQRPEYLGGGTAPISIYPVAQTGATGATGTPQGNVAGFGVSQHSGMGFTKSFTEHCLLIGLVSVRADLTYQQGMERMWSRQTRLDFYWPALSQIGEQSVLNQEIFCDGSGSAGNDGAVFGYQERYAEYRYKPSKVTGLFKSTSASAVDFWHLAQKFNSLPALNNVFIQDATKDVLPRAVAVTTEPQFYFDAYFSLKCARPMPTYGIPGMIDHF